MQNSSSGGRWGKRFKLKIRHGVLAMLVLSIPAVVLPVVILRSQAKPGLAALRAAGYPTSLAELAEWSKLPSGVRNAADVYGQAFAAFVPPMDKANVPFLGSAKLPDSPGPLPEAMVRGMTRCLAANERCLSLLHIAAGIEHCRYDWDGSQLATTGLPASSDVRRCAQLLRLAVALHVDQGNTDAAVACIRDGLHLAESLKGELLQIAYLVRAACHGLLLGGLEQTLSTVALTDRQLAELSGELAAVRGSLDLTRVMIGERCLMLDHCRDPSLMSGGGGWGLSLPGVRGRGMVDTLDFMARVIDATDLPPSARRARLHEIEQDVADLSVLHVMIKTLAPAVVRVVELDLRFQAGLDMAHTALAVERYRLSTGRVPEQLSQLIPEHLDRVPIDPFDGQPIRYYRTDPGYVLYSIWIDARDNGGFGPEDVQRGAPHDWPFRVK